MPHFQNQTGQVVIPRTLWDSDDAEHIQESRNAHSSGLGIGPPKHNKMIVSDPGHAQQHQARIFENSAPAA